MNNVMDNMKELEKKLKELEREYSVKLSALDGASGGTVLYGAKKNAAQPSESEADEISEGTCHALRSQIAILSDGTVVPCCLDAEGTLALGNLLESPLDDILQSPRARAIYDNFTNRRAIEPLCRRCDYAKRFSKR